MATCESSCALNPAVKMISVHFSCSPLSGPQVHHAPAGTSNLDKGRLAVHPAAQLRALPRPKCGMLLEMEPGPLPGADVAQLKSPLVAHRAESRPGFAPRDEPMEAIEIDVGETLKQGLRRDEPDCRRDFPQRTEPRIGFPHPASCAQPDMRPAATPIRRQPLWNESRALGQDEPVHLGAPADDIPRLVAPPVRILDEEVGERGAEHPEPAPNPRRQSRGLAIPLG